MNPSTHVDRPAPHGATRTLRRPAGVAALAALVPLAVLLAACGGTASGSTTAGAPSTAPSGRTSQLGDAGQGGRGGPAGQGGGAFPGTFGLIAAASPGVLEVQGTDAQTTVTYSGATRFTQTVAARLAAGDCVMVVGTPVAGSAAAVTATSVRVEAKVNGSCPAADRRGAGGFGGPGGGPGGSGGSGGRGEGPGNGVGDSGAPRPSGAPSGAQGQRAFAAASGTVTAVSGSTVTVQGVLREGRPTGSPAASPSNAPTTITVTLGPTTTVTQAAAATSAAAVVGRCASAIGKANDRGDIAATTIVISTPDANGCRAGFGRFGADRQGGAGQGGASAGSGSGTNA